MDKMLTERSIYYVVCINCSTFAKNADQIADNEDNNGWDFSARPGTNPATTERVCFYHGGDHEAVSLLP
jgi:hypothetical protein